MSLPSIPLVARQLGVLIKSASSDELERVIVGAMRRDLPLAVDYLERHARETRATGKSTFGNEDPNSTLGKQLTRICAGTVLRELAEKHFCGGLRLSFLNCCGPVLSPQGEKPDKDALIKRQISMQDGTIAHADC